MKTVVFIGLMTLTGAFSGCEQEKAIAPVSVAQLEGKWRLIDPSSTSETTLNLTLQPPIATVYTTASRFQGTGKTVVNSYSAALTISELTTQQLTIDSVGRTKVGGSPEAMAFEQAYFASLQGVTQYELTSQNRLRLYVTGVQPGLLMYEKVN